MTERARKDQLGVTAAGVPPGLEQRLRALRELYVAERDVDARARLARERPPERRSFAELVAERLRELRALQELAAHLHGARSLADGTGTPRELDLIRFGGHPRSVQSA